MRKQFRELSSLDDTLDVLDGLEVAGGTETVTLEQATGRRLAESVRAPIDVPGFDRSIMDGYAVVADDTVGAYDDDPIELTLVGSVSPGVEPEISIETGQAVEIATGAVIPPGADAVVMVERTQRDGDTVEVFRPVTPGEHVMSRGADIPTGETILRAGDRLDPRRIGLAAALGIDALVVRTRPTVGLISTGSEIVRPTQADELDPGEIFDINTFSLAAAVEEAGATAKVFPHAEDDYDEIRRVFDTAATQCDLVISSGSTSASAEDVVYRVVEDIGELLLHGVALKPGKPTVIGQIDSTPVLGLPGNPISALMTFRVFGRLLLDAEEDPPTREATLAVAIDSEFGRTQLLPVGLVESPGEGLFSYDVDKGSGAITSLADADGFIQIDDNVNYLEAGSTVTVQLLARDITPPSVLIGGEYCQVLDGVIDDLEESTRWLAGGAVDGVRKLRDGIVDIAGVNLSEEAIAAHELEGIDRAPCYERHVVLVHGEDRSSNELAIEEFGTIGTTDRQTGLYQRLEGLAPDATIREYPSQQSALRAVRAGEVDGALVLEAAVTDGDLTQISVGWETFSLLVARNRRTKPAVERLIEAVSNAAVEHTTGYRTVAQAEVD